MLVRPAEMDSTSPMCGFSATTKKLWNETCSINAALPSIMMRPYAIQSSISRSLAPDSRAIGSIKIAQATDRITPKMITL